MLNSGRNKNSTKLRIYILSSVDGSLMHIFKHAIQFSLFFVKLELMKKSFQKQDIES